MTRYVQIRRTKGFRTPPNTVRCMRPGRLGNPFRVGMFKGYTAAHAVRDYRLWLDRDLTVRSTENVFGRPPTCEQIVAELNGKDAGCCCAEGDPCHVQDVLIPLLASVEAQRRLRERQGE